MRAHPANVPARYLAILAHRLRWRKPIPPPQRVLAPRTLNEKIVRKMLLDGRDYLVTTSDKLAVRSHVAAIAGRDVLTELYQTAATPEAIDFRRLPDQFVLKPTHLSGEVAVVVDKAAADLDQLRAQAGAWLEQAYGRFKGEWWYLKIPPKLIVEEFLSDGGESPPDFKLFAMNGGIELIQVDTGRARKHHRELFLPDWTRVDCTLKFSSPPTPTPRPPLLDDMITLAGMLSHGTDFVRVDLYQLPGRIVFGELTHAPGNGAEEFSSKEFHHWLGARWEQPRRYTPE